jgi:hypothetical protein
MITAKLAGNAELGALDAKYRPTGRLPEKLRRQVQ